MTRDEVIRMAEEAGCTILNVPGVGAIARYNDIRVTNLLDRFAAIVASAEREECAKVCDALAHEWRGANSRIVECAAAIRARGAAGKESGNV